MTKPVKKVATRKYPDGSQQYTSAAWARDKGKISKTVKAARNSKTKINPKLLGVAASEAFMQYGSKDKAVKTLASMRVEKAKGKPKGGR